MTIILSMIIFPLSSVIDGEKIPSEYMWLLYGLDTICLVILLVAILGPRDKSKSWVSKKLELVGKMSLEMYMSHIIILHLFTYYGWLEKFGLWTFAVITTVALAVSWTVHYIIENMTRITARRK